MTEVKAVAPTPGPWTCKPVEDGSYALNPSGAGWLQCTKDEAWANAALIAAAPDLLEVVKACRDVVYRDPKAPSNLAALCDAAIAKAEG
jgi:hypothetical protein